MNKTDYIYPHFVYVYLRFLCFATTNNTKKTPLYISFSTQWQTYLVFIFKSRTFLSQTFHHHFCFFLFHEKVLNNLCCVFVFWIQKPGVLGNSVSVCIPSFQTACINNLTMPHGFNCQWLWKYLQTQPPNCLLDSSQLKT